jgi:malonyl-CoA O-methyltransferase
VVIVCAQAEKLPLQDQSMDLIFANLLLPWHADVEQLLWEWRRVLRADGLLMLTALGPDTLQEWEGVFPAPSIPQRIDMHDVGDMLVRAGFADPVLDVDYYTLTYNDKEKLIFELYSSEMLIPSVDLSAQIPPDERSWSVTYEIIYAHAFAPQPHDASSLRQDGLVKIPLSHLRKKK